MAKKTTKRIASVKEIEQTIHVIRGQRVMLDSDLAALYGVPTHRLNEQVARNKERFPEDLRISTYSVRVYVFDIVNCDTKRRPGWKTKTTLGLHRTRRGHALQRAEVADRRSREYREHASVRPHASPNGNTR